MKSESTFPSPENPQYSKELQEALEARRHPQKDEMIYETTQIGGDIYDVAKIEDLAESLPIKDVPLEQIKGAVSEGHKYWVDRNGEMFGPHDLLKDWDAALKNPVWADHIGTILLANKNNPIWQHQDGTVFNGMHRLTKAFVDGDETIKLRYFESLPDEAKVEVADRKQLENALEILGEEQFLGPDDIGKAFDFSLENYPDIPYSPERLQEAKDNGEILVLRISESPNGTPATIETLLRLRESQGKRLFAKDSTDLRDEQFSDKEELWQEGMAFLDETPGLEWKLIRTDAIPGTEHLSQNLQNAIVDRATDSELKKLLSEQVEFWKEIWMDPSKERDYNPELYQEAMSKSPTLDSLKEIRDSLPDYVTLPSAIEVIYDQLVYEAKTGKALYNDITVATRSVVTPYEDEPTRPIDIAFKDPSKGINMHLRRSMKMGRPGSLGDLKAGVPIGHLDLSR